MVEDLEKVKALIKVYEQAQRLSAEIETFRSRSATALALAAITEAQAHILEAEIVLLRLQIRTPTGLFAWRRETKTVALKKELASTEEEAARLAERAQVARAEAHLCLKEIPAGEHALTEVRTQLIGAPDLVDLRACELILTQGRPAAS